MSNLNEFQLLLHSMGLHVYENLTCTISNTSCSMQYTCELNLHNITLKYFMQQRQMF